MSLGLGPNDEMRRGLIFLRSTIPIFKSIIVLYAIIGTTCGQNFTTAISVLEDTTESSTLAPEVTVEPVTNSTADPGVDNVDDNTVDNVDDNGVDNVEPTVPPRPVTSLEAVQQELDQSCCFILDIDCELVLSVMEPLKRRRRENRETDHTSPEPGHRYKRQTNLSDRFIDQLGVNLLRFETCLCQAVTAPSTCRMLYPPDFYRPDTPQEFTTVFQEKEFVKRMSCSFYSGSVVDCTFEKSVPYDLNVTSEVTTLLKIAQSYAVGECVACTSLFCTFAVFKRRLQPQNTSFNQDYDNCIAETSGPDLTPTRPTASPPSSGPNGHSGRNDHWLSTSELYQYLSAAIFPMIPTPRDVFPRLSESGIFLGLGRLGGNTTMTELYGLHTLFNGDNHLYGHGYGKDGVGHEHEDHSSLTVIVGAVVGGLLAGAFITLVLLFIAYKRRPTTTRSRSKVSRSLRDVPIVKLDSEDLSPMPNSMADIQPPVARVPPMMTVYPRRPSDVPSTSGSRLGTGRESLIHLTGPTGFSSGNPYLLEMDACTDHYNVSYEDTEEQLSTGIYSSVDDEQMMLNTGKDQASMVSTSLATSPTLSKTSDKTLKKSPRASRVPEVPVMMLMAPMPRGKTSTKADVGKSLGIVSRSKRPRPKGSPLPRPVIKPPVLPKPNPASLDTPDSTKPAASPSSKHSRPMSAPVLPRLLKAKPLSATNSLEPPISTCLDTISDLITPNFTSDNAGIYEVPVIPKNKKPRTGPPSIPPPPIPANSPPPKPSLPIAKLPPPIPPVSPTNPLPPIPAVPSAKSPPSSPANSPIAQSPPVSTFSKNVESRVPPLPKIRGQLKNPPVPQMRNNIPRTSRRSQISKASSHGGSEWSECAQWDEADLESDISDMENEYMEIRPDPDDPSKPAAQADGESGYTKIY